MSQAVRYDEEALWFWVARHCVTPRTAGPLLGIPPNRVRYLYEKWARQGRYEWGVCHDIGWAAVAYE